MPSSSPLYGDEKYAKFFKVFLPEDCSYQLHICSDFKIHLQSINIRRKVTIHRPGTNQNWDVLLEKVNDEYYFTKGWKTFVRENDINVGEFMVFAYHGNSYFSVKLFGTHACLKETVNEDEDEEPVDVKPIKIITNNRRPGAGRPPSYDPDDRLAREAEEYRSAHPDIPSFMVVITSSYFNHKLVNVPLKWMNENMPGDDERYIKLKLKGSSSRMTWRVKMTVYRPSSGTNCKMSKGLSVFFPDNGIQVGDICVFELDKNVPDTLKVTIFRRNY